MKIKYKIFLLLVSSLFVNSCDKGDVFTGSPVNSNVEFVTLNGTVSTPDAFVVGSQDLPITVTIPQAFDVDVNVQVTAFVPNINRKSTKTVLFHAGLTTVDSTIKLPAGDSTELPFDLNLQLYLTGITTAPTTDITIPSGFKGKQYIMTSNIVDLNYGDSPLGATNSKRCAIRFDYPDFIKATTPPIPTSYNNLNIRLKKDGVVTPVSGNSTQPINGTTTSPIRGEAVNFLDTATDGTYTIEVFAVKLITSPVDLPYRFTIRFPENTSKIIRGVLPALTLGTVSTAIPKLKIERTTTVTGVKYEVTSL
jgi:hypothetical protein